MLLQIGRWVGVFVGDAITDVVLSAFGANVIARTQAPVGKKLIWLLPFVARAW